MKLLCVKCRKPIGPNDVRTWGFTKNSKLRYGHVDCIGYPTKFRGILYGNYCDPTVLYMLINAR